MSFYFSGTVLRLESFANFLQGWSLFAYRFEYSLPPNSPDGDPAPDLAFPVVPTIPFMLVGFPKGDRTELAVPDGGSTGEVLAVEDPDRERFADI